MNMSVYAENIKMSYKYMGRKSPIAKVKRSLFGKVDPEDSQNFIHNQLNHELAKSCAKWNFNFREERTLDPEGDFIWHSASPILINRKRKVVEIDGNAAYYFQPIEPAARSPEKQAAKAQKQTHITDYMVKSKRAAVCKKEPSVERPMKIPKLADFCSS